MAQSPHAACLPGKPCRFIWACRGPQSRGTLPETKGSRDGSHCAGNGACEEARSPPPPPIPSSQRKRNEQGQQELEAVFKLSKSRPCLLASLGCPQNPGPAQNIQGVWRPVEKKIMGNERHLGQEREQQRRSGKENRSQGPVPCLCFFLCLQRPHSTWPVGKGAGGEWWRDSQQ